MQLFGQYQILKLRYSPEPIRFNQAQEEPAPYLFSFPYTAISLSLTRLFFQKIRTQPSRKENPPLYYIFQKMKQQVEK